jgi:hypothetical protein
LLAGDSFFVSTVTFRIVNIAVSFVATFLLWILMAEERRKVGEDGEDLGEISIFQLIQREARLDE